MEQKLGLVSPRLDAIPLAEFLLDDWGETRHLRSPSRRVVLLESVEKLIEHSVQLWRRLVPFNDGVTEPEQALKIVKRFA